MKRLMFATSLAATVAALVLGSSEAMATPTALSATGFEGYPLNGKKIENSDAELDESGVEMQSGSDYITYFYFDGESNSSVVTNDAPSTGDGAPRTAFFANDTNTKYLALDTEGGTFWRSINSVVPSAEGSLGAAQTVAATGTYLDTLVQFTVTEDEAPTTSASDKLAIWLGVSTNAQGEVTGTNLMVRAGYLDDNGSDSFVTATDFILSTAEPIEAGRWYRLTVKTIGDVTGCVAKNPSEYSSGYIGFEIYLDGVQLAAEEATISAAYMNVATGADVYAWLNQSTDADFIAYLQSKKVFPSLQGKQEAYAIQGVGFQGTGAVDEIVWTEDNPFPAASPIDFTLTWTAAEVSAVSYVLSTDLTTTNSLTSGTAVQLAPGDGTATIELIPTFTTGYEFDKVTMGETELGLTFAIPGVTTNATLLAKAAAPAYPDYIGTTDAAIKAKYDAWKTKVGYDDSTASSHLNQFLLDVDETATVGDTALEITEIKQNATAGWDITIGCALDGVGLTGTVGETIVCNGYLAVSYTDDLAGTWTTENISVTAVDATAGTVTVTVNKSGAKFMKVTLTAAPQPAANN